MKPLLDTLAFILVLEAIPCCSIARAEDYLARRVTIEMRDASNRKVPVIPAKEKQLRVIIDTDARNEIDDVWAIGLAITSPERFKIEGFVAASYDNKNPGAGPDSIQMSAKEIATILEKAGLQGKYPIKLGSPPMRYQFEPSESEGVDFIIDKAMASTPEDPLWVIGLGAATDIASAYLKEPRIADRIVVFWHFRTNWPNACTNFNVFGDVHAARLVFHSNLSFVLFDTGKHLTCPMDESAKWQAFGALGKYLHGFRFEHEWFQNPVKGFYDLGDISALVDPDLAEWEVVECPVVERNLNYKFKGTMGRILRCKDIDRDKTFSLLNQQLGRFDDSQADDHELHLRLTTQQQTERVVRNETWNPKHTAVIVCDMWDAHHCYRAVQREQQMIPRMQALLQNLRNRGVAVIHAPSSCMDAYADHPARTRVHAVPKSMPPKQINEWCDSIPAEESVKYPLDQSDGGDDDTAEEHAAWSAKLSAMGRDPKTPWKKQVDALTIDGERDFISDRGDEIWNILQAGEIEHVILVGVHTNMCVLGRPFGLRQLVKNGLNVVLMRDLTDSMYNPKAWPYVSHQEGTDLILTHIERHICPTITSDQVLGGEAFQFGPLEDK